MKIIALIPLLFLYGCVSKIDAPTSNNYSTLEKIPYVKVEPSNATFPKARVISASGVEYMAFTAEEGDQILAYRNASQNNKIALGHMVEAHNEIIAERNVLVGALQLEEARKNYMAERYAEAENDYRYEKRENLIETSIYKAIIVIIGLVAI